MGTVLTEKGVGDLRDRALQLVEKLPPLSPSTGRLLSKLAFLNADIREVSSFVEKDALLCAHILRTVNSAAYGRARTVSTVAQAVTLLGSSTLRKIALGFTISNLFRKLEVAPSFSRLRFNLHSAAVGILTDAISGNRDGAFVAGMLHDLGHLLIAIGLPRQYETVSTFNVLTGRPMFECERELLSIDHAQLSAVILESWRMPAEICDAVKFHHSADQEGAPLLSVAINLADAFVNHAGISIQVPSITNDPPPSIQIPGVQMDEEAVLERFDREWKELSQFFS